MIQFFLCYNKTYSAMTKYEYKYCYRDNGGNEDGINNDNADNGSGSYGPILC